MSVRTVRLAVLALLATAAVLLLGRVAGEYLGAFGAWVGRQGAWGAAAFVAGYALASIAFVPASILSLAAGAIFGILAGTAYTFAGAVLGSAGAFLIARYLARPAVARRLARDVRFVRIDRAVAERGRGIVFLLRLSPLLPFAPLNYALGLTRVRFSDYLAASVGMLPGTLLYVYSGRVAGDLAALLGGAGVTRGRGYYLLLALGLAATAAVTLWVTRIARRALREGDTR